MVGEANSLNNAEREQPLSTFRDPPLSLNEQRSVSGHRQPFAPVSSLLPSFLTDSLVNLELIASGFETPPGVVPHGFVFNEDSS